MSHECDSILHFQNITADDNNLDVMLSHENDTYIEQDDTDMEKQINSTLLFPTVRFFIIDVSFDLQHVNVIPFYVFQNVTADDDNQDAFFSNEVNNGNSTDNFDDEDYEDYEDYEDHTTNNNTDTDTDTDMEKQMNATLFPTVRFFIIDVSFDSWHVNVIPFYVFQNVTEDDDNQDAFFSNEVNNGNSTDNFDDEDYEDYEDHTTNNNTDADIEKQGNATLFPTVGFFIIDVSFDSWHVNVIPFYVFRALRMTITKMPFFPMR